MNIISFFLLTVLLSAFSIHAETPEDQYYTDFRKALTNSVPITTNIFFYLSSRESHLSPKAEFRSDETIVSGFVLVPLLPPPTGTNTRAIIKFRVFSQSQSFVFHLYDDKGKEVKKTKKGLANSQQPVMPTGASPNLPLRLIGEGSSDDRELFRPDEMFVIPNKGLYTLEIRACIAVPMTNNMVDYPAMKVPMEPHYYNNNLGIITSEPLRVKIIKN